MVIRRSDPRRRRVGVLLDDNTAEVKADVETTSAPRQETSAVKPPEAYCNSAQRRHLSKTTDLIPKRFLSFALLILGLITVYAIINWAYMFSGQLAKIAGEEVRQSFSLTGRGNLSQWFTSFLLIVSGMASLQIYALRQHRNNDYRGTYRLWFCLALLMIFASVDCAVGLHQIALNSLSYFTGFVGSHAGWQLITFKIIALSILVVRGIFEVRQSVGALVAVLFVWFAYVGATLMQLPQARTNAVFQYEPVYGNLMLLGTISLFLAVVTYARYVYLMSQGLIQAKIKPVAVPEAEAAGEQEKATKVAAKKTKTRKSTSDKKSKKASRATEVVEESAATAEPQVTVKSKANKQKTKTAKELLLGRGTRPKVAAGTEAEPPQPQTEELESSDSSPIESLPLGRKLSKSQRRKERKAQKQRRAA